MNTLLNFPPSKSAANNTNKSDYNAKDIEVLEGLEPVRKRPGMYIGGTDRNALHHLIAEVLDNSMDEAIAGYASMIIIHLRADGSISIADNGRGIPIDRHPKYPDKSALEVIMTTLHSGGKFGGDVYQTAGGLHGVGVSVVNALSARLEVQVMRGRNLYTQHYERGIPKAELQVKSVKASGSGTTITFLPDPEIFPECDFEPAKVRSIITSKGYLHKGVHLVWRCDNALLRGPVSIDVDDAQDVPLSLGYTEEQIQFPNGLRDYLQMLAEGNEVLSDLVLSHETVFPDKQGKVEWALAWLVNGDYCISRFYCNTIHTVNGGSHESGFRSGIIKAVRNYGLMSANKKAVDKLTIEDVLSNAVIVLSLFIPNPVFQGQTKEKLLNPEAAKLVESAVRNHLEQWFVANNNAANVLLQTFVDNAELRRKLKQAKEVARKTPVKSMRLPGKLADCMNPVTSGSELFIVEGDSAGGTAKQARDKLYQAILPLKGKILNVASNSIEKIKSNQEIADLVTALGCGVGASYKLDQLRYDKVIIMTDADVDGAHIASLLMTFFFLQMPELIHRGHLYLAQPPLYKLKHGNNYHYAHNDQEKAALMAKLGQNIEIGRFKGLGEMNPAQLKSTTMDPKTRVLLQVKVEDSSVVADTVERLMGRKPEHRLRFIQETSQLFGVKALNELLDV